MSRTPSSVERRTLSSRIAAAGVLFLALAGCGGGSEGTSPVAVDDFAKAIADAVCGNVGPCCRLEGHAFDSNACHTKAEEQLGKFVTQGKAEGITYDADAAGQCVAEYANVARSCGEPQSIEATCRKVFRGTKMAGESCSSGIQCMSGHCGPDGNELKCDPKQDLGLRRKKGESCEGTCTKYDDNVETCGGPIPPGGVSPPNERPGCYTNDGLFCGPDFTCQTIPALGEACTVGSPCAGDAFCQAGTCAPKRSTGTCSDASDACASSAFCDFTSRQCLPRKGAGEPCSSGSECQSPNLCLSSGDAPSAGTCKRPTVATEDICLGK